MWSWILKVLRTLRTLRTAKDKGTKGVTSVASTANFKNFKNSKNFKENPLQVYFPLSKLMEEAVQTMEQWKGKKLWQLPFFRLPESLAPASLSWLEYAKVYRLWPSHLKVELKPKRPKALYLLEKNKGLKKWQFLFEDGTLSKAFSTSHLSLKERKMFKTFFGKPLGLQEEESQALRKRALQLLVSLKQSPSEVLTKVKEIQFSELHGFTLGPSSRIHLGLQDFTLKLRRVAKVIQYLKEKNLQWRVIDAELSHKILVSTRKSY